MKLQFIFNQFTYFRSIHIFYSSMTSFITRKYQESTHPIDEKTNLLNNIEYGTINTSLSIESNDLNDNQLSQDSLIKNKTKIFFCISSLLSILCFAYFYYSSFPITNPPMLNSAWSSKAEPFSFVDPVDIGFLTVNRPMSSRPGEILSNLVEKDSISGAPQTPLPTNAWYENLLLGASNKDPENKVFQVPYVIDAAGLIPGIRSHPSHLQANDRTVLMNFEPENAVTLGAVEKLMDQHYVHKQAHSDIYTISKLAIELEWVSEEYHTTGSGPTFRSPIVRGSPYTSMKYYDTTPQIFAQRALKGSIVIDNGNTDQVLECGTGSGVFSSTPVLVQRELKVQFEVSDYTWLIFVSQPTEFTCSNQIHDPSNDPYTEPGRIPLFDASKAAFFDLRATKPMHRGMVRIAMSNNCTTGLNPITCDNHKPRDQKEFETLLRDHAEIYPTSKADIQFTFPVSSSEEEELRLTFNWNPMTMASVGFEDYDSKIPADKIPNIPLTSGPLNIPHTELLMYALPHHQERMRPIVGSSNAVQAHGCQSNLHGTACPALGASWSLVEHLHRTSFSAPRAPRSEMVSVIQAALQKDIHYELPANYMAGQGDTYFSGKMLAKLARILLLAHEFEGVKKSDFNDALGRLRAGVEIWLNGSAASPMLYDRSWGGIVMCGCNYFYDEVTKKSGCNNKFPDCPAITDAGHNFGAGFYNDHHYHFGYHIYAAAVIAKFDAVWGRKFHQHVLMLVRDIANPSDDDKYFPTWRHKDWYLGWSWASGIVTIGGKPYPNGRNQESVSEAISAYEGVALYGDAMSAIFDAGTNEADGSLLQHCLRIRDMGRLLMATEIRAAKTYWHVQSPGTVGVARVYPDIYGPKVIGMMWSVLSQLQTWFGNEEWKSYGIQLMPITPASELRDDGTWVAEMLPLLTKSCFNDKNCKDSGWAVLVYSMLGATGNWKEGLKGVQSLNESAFLDAGGNGHSLSNALWYIATRPK